MQAAVVATMQKHQGRNLAKLARNYECNLMAYILKKIVAVNKYKGTIQ